MVLVDESTEHVPAASIARADLDRLPGPCERWSEAEGAMWSLPVVVLRVGGPYLRVQRFDHLHLALDRIALLAGITGMAISDDECHTPERVCYAVPIPS